MELHHFVLSAPENAVAGELFTLSITACDVSGNTVQDYSGTVNLEPSGEGILSPTVATGFVNGQVEVQITCTKDEDLTITAYDSVNPEISGTSNVIYVEPGDRQVSFLV